MRNTTVYVADEGPPVANAIAWFASSKYQAEYVCRLTISERGLSDDQRDIQDRIISPREIMDLCNATPFVTDVTLRGLDVALEGPFAQDAPMGPDTVHSLTIASPAIEVTLPAVASVATRFRNLQTLNIEGPDGQLDSVSMAHLQHYLRRRDLPIRELRVKRSGVDQLDGINVLLRKTASTLRHLSIELFPTPQLHYEILGPVRADLTGLHQLRELDVYIPILGYTSGYDPSAHLSPARDMLRSIPKRVEEVHVVFWNECDTRGAFIKAMARFPVRALLAPLLRVQVKITFTAGTQGSSATDRAAHWGHILERSRTWRETCEELRPTLTLA
ncbi:hypothetical protein PsYK624_138280 [Phanerochaete sordida]|uniref:Uncharacterized protein n=1 Tax=Phanerochaete sordida TaxID=48140 RepID=A0A9P3GLM3_9APHY|nr:hypothetical protein PsYK624_138280 [Phanerochaete sordida]